MLHPTIGEGLTKRGRRTRVRSLYANERLGLRGAHACSSTRARGASPALNDPPSWPASFWLASWLRTRTSDSIRDCTGGGSAETAVAVVAAVADAGALSQKKRSLPPSSPSASRSSNINQKRAPGPSAAVAEAAAAVAAAGGAAAPPSRPAVPVAPSDVPGVVASTPHGALARVERREDGSVKYDYGKRYSKNAIE